MNTEVKQTPIGRIALPNVRLSFPGLWKAEAFKPGDEAKFKATFLIPKGSPLEAEVNAKILAVVKANYPTPGKAEQIVKSIRGNPNKFCFQDGDTKSYDGYEGMMALSAKSTTRPTVLDANKSPLTEADGRPYAGCYVNANIEFFVYDSQGVGISASLRGVQFKRDGDSFGGGSAATADEFADVSEGADADDLS